MHPIITATSRKMLLPGPDVGFIILIVATGCLGSWPNFFRAFPLGVRPELPFFDFTWTGLVVALVLALMFGNTGFDIPDFFDNMAGLRSGPLLVIFSLLAGACLAIGNMLYLQGMNVTGQTTAAPVAHGISLLIGLGLIYSISGITNRVDLLRHYLFPGLLLIAIGVVCAAAAQVIKTNYQRAKLRREEEGASVDMSGAFESHTSSDEVQMQSLALPSDRATTTTTSSAMENGTNSSAPQTQPANTVELESIDMTRSIDLSFVPRRVSDFPDQFEPDNVASQLLMRVLPGTRAQRSQIHAFFICAIGGLVMGMWRVFSNLALESRYMTPYSANFLFFSGAALGYLIAGPLLLLRPFTGRRGSIYDYQRLMGKAQHWQAIVSGFLFTFGVCLMFISEHGTGYAVCFMFSHLSPLVVSIWGIVYWREFEDTPRESKYWLAGMFASYILGLFIILLSHFPVLSLV